MNLYQFSNKKCKNSSIRFVVKLIKTVGVDKESDTLFNCISSKKETFLTFKISEIMDQHLKKSLEYPKNQKKNREIK